eukprot:scaffold55911_cov69-Phaeocystis_antarctica.AAC.2
MSAPLAIGVGSGRRQQPSHKLGGLVCGLVHQLVLLVLLELEQRGVFIAGAALARAAAGRRLGCSSGLNAPITGRVVREVRAAEWWSLLAVRLRLHVNAP